MKEVSRFNELQRKREELAQLNFTTNKDPQTRLFNVMEELGELARAERLLKDDPTWKLPIEKMKDSIGDIVISLAGYCTSRDIYFHDCINKAWNVVSNRWLTGQKRGTDFEKDNHYNSITNSNEL